LKATLDGNPTTVWLPISSSVTGAAVTLEIVVSTVIIQRVEA